MFVNSKSDFRGVLHIIRKLAEKRLLKMRWYVEKGTIMRI